MQNKIAIITIGYNSKKYLKNYFFSLMNSTYKNFKIIFIDNKSSDNSVDWIKNNYPKTIIIRNKKNVGFAEGCNIGIRRALKMNFDYLFLLNPDTIIDRNCLKYLSNQADQNTILQPLILIHQKKKTNLINATGNVINYLGFAYCAGYKRKAKYIKKNKEISSASGAAIFIPRNIIKKIGIFDKDFFMYHEDIDFCWRARLAGFKIILISKSRIWHKYKFSENKNKWFYSERNRLQFIFKNFNIKTLLLISPMFILNEILVIFYSIINGWFFKKFNSYISLLLLLNKSIKKRKNIQKIRLKNDKELRNFLIPKVNFQEVKLPVNKIYNLLVGSYWNAIKGYI